MEPQVLTDVDAVLFKQLQNRNCSTHSFSPWWHMFDSKFQNATISLLYICSIIKDYIHFSLLVRSILEVIGPLEDPLGVFRRQRFHPVVTNITYNCNLTSYIASVRVLSRIALKPRAPVFLTIAFLAISLRAASVKCSFTWKLI